MNLGGCIYGLAISAETGSGGEDSCQPHINTRSKKSEIVSGRFSRNKSGFKGVSWDNGKERWLATICVDCKRIYLGRFDQVTDAARAYNEAAIKYHGEFAWQNRI